MADEGFFASCRYALAILRITGLNHPKSLQITRHTMPSKFVRNSFKTKDWRTNYSTHN